MTRVIFHLDMDAFFASVEQRDHPEFRGRPLIVGGKSRRGVVSAASYEVRKFGVHSAMPMAKALKLCPDAIVVSPDLEKYGAASKIIMDVMRQYSPVVEPLSLDEAFMDMTGTEKLFGAPEDVAQKLKNDIFEKTRGLTSSVGIAPNKFLAKIASDMNKPDGIAVIPFGKEAESIAHLKIERMWGVGKKSSVILRNIGLDTIGDIAKTDMGLLKKKVGDALATHIWTLARGEDQRVVISDLSRKSIGSEGTFDYDISGMDTVKRSIRHHCESVAESLRKKNIKARGVRIKIRFSDGFILQTRQARLSAPFDDSGTMYAAATRLLKSIDLDQRIRLVGASAYELVEDETPEQIDLLSTGAKEKRSQLEHTLDAINAKLGVRVHRGTEGD